MLPEESVLHNAVRGTGGPLAEAHILVLHELYSRYDDNRGSETMVVASCLQNMQSGWAKDMRRSATMKRHDFITR